jgi:hypothetical protein
MESLFLLAFGEEKSLAAPAMTGSDAFFNKLLVVDGFVAIMWRIVTRYTFSKKLHVYKKSHIKL